MALILDTGVVLALMSSDDRHHRACVELLDATDEPLIVPAATLIEIDYWIWKMFSPEVWRAFAADLEGGAFILEPTIPADVARAAEIEVQYRNLDIGFVDASVIALCERLGERKVATLDRRHFSVVVPRHAPYLELLPA